MFAKLCLTPSSAPRLIDDLDFLVLRFPDYGKNFIKSVRCSPDAYLQLALQLAYYRYAELKYYFSRGAMRGNTGEGFEVRVRSSPEKAKPVPGGAERSGSFEPFCRIKQCRYY